VADPRTLRARTLLGWVAVALALVVGLSILVGFKGPKKGFQWELAAVFGTAFGTTLLAAATGALAYSTWSEVGATWELAKLTKRDQDERQRPIVLQETAVYEGGGEQGGRQEGWLNIELRNVGLGPALRVEVKAKYFDDDYQPTIGPNPSILPALAPNETKPFRVFVRFEEKSPPEGVRSDGFPLSGTFTDRLQTGNYDIITHW
jgi:hypothetical protein